MPPKRREPASSPPLPRALSIALEIVCVVGIVAALLTGRPALAAVLIVLLLGFALSTERAVRHHRDDCEDPPASSVVKSPVSK